MTYATSTGGVIDDVFVYGLKDTKRAFNDCDGSTHEKDVAWLRKNVASGVIISDLEGRAVLRSKTESARHH